MASAKRGNVHAHLALVDRRLLVLVVELDRVFDRDDVVVEVVVHVVDHRRQRGRLAGTGRARHQAPARAAAYTDRPAPAACPRSLKFKSFAGICRSTIATLPRCLKIETRKRAWSPKAKPKSESADLLQLLLAPLGRDALHQRHGVFRLEDLGFQPYQPPIEPQHRRLAHRNVQVARLAGNHGLEQFIDKDTCHELPRFPEETAHPEPLGHRASAALCSEKRRVAPRLFAAYCRVPNILSYYRPSPHARPRLGTGTLRIPSPTSGSSRPAANPSVSPSETPLPG